MTQRSISVINWTAIRACINRANTLDFTTPSGHTALLGELLYNGPSGFAKTDTNGDTVYDISHSFTWVYPGWNWIYDPDINDFIQHVGGDGVKPFYLSEDLNIIFQ